MSKSVKSCSKTVLSVVSKVVIQTFNIISGEDYTEKDVFKCYFKEYWISILLLMEITSITRTGIDFITLHIYRNLIYYILIYECLCTWGCPDEVLSNHNYIDIVRVKS